MRIILVTGKGGVGKTSVAAATALRSAELGYKTIILSTDTAHSLSDSFDTLVGNEPRLITPNLWGAGNRAVPHLRGSLGNHPEIYVSAASLAGDG